MGSNMKCPNCGADIEEGKLLCENCGQEINIVPEYDIELEDRLKESLNTVLEEMESHDFVRHSYEDEIEIRDDEFNSLFVEKIQKYLPVVAAIVVIIIAVLFARYMSTRSKDNSFDYQYEQALEKAADGNYTDAIDYLERALAINPDDTDSRFLLADYYEKNENVQGAVSILEEIINDSPSYSNIESVYERLFDIYEGNSQYDKIGNQLKDCENERILSKYNQYAAGEPIFNKEGGIYDSLISISISGNTDGFIYFTLDGSNPTQNSQVYETPILLESGDYEIRAMFVNLYGVSSDVVTQNYYINLIIPQVPTVVPESGNYSEPSMIEAGSDENVKIYYTTDGSVPDKNSNRYMGQLEMPYGISNYSFVAIDESGVASDVVSRTYQLEIQANFTPDVAITVLKNNLWAMGELSTADGNVPGKMGLNQYITSTLYGDGENIYYIFYEEYVDTTGTAHTTGNYFAVNTDNGDLYRAYRIGEGKYNLVNLTAG